MSPANTNGQKSRLHRGKRFWSWAPSLSHTARFFLHRKGWGQSAQRDKVTRAVGAAGSGSVGMPPPGWGTGERKTPKKPSWGFVTRLGAAAPPGRVPLAPGDSWVPSAQRGRPCRDALTAMSERRDGEALPEGFRRCLKSPSRVQQAGFCFSTAARHPAHPFLFPCHGATRQPASIKPPG